MCLPKRNRGMVVVDIPVVDSTWAKYTVQRLRKISKNLKY